MNTIKLKIVLVGIFLLTLYSCHKDEEYYCYLVEYDWPNGPDTLAVYGQGVWFYKRKSIPQDECKVDRAEMVIENEGNPNYSCLCECRWE